jgi:hypothetical protein
MQTKFGEPSGNCMEACIASILEIPLDDVPVLAQYHGEEMEDQWFFVLSEWLLETHGLIIMTFELSSGDEPRCIDICSAMLADCYHIMAGPGPRGHQHAIVGCNGQPVHDPHPSGEGLLGITAIDLLLQPGVPMGRA